MPIDYDNYPANWSAEIVPRILKRAGHKCEECGLPDRTKAWSVTIKIKDEETGRYKPKAIWLQIYQYALSLVGYNPKLVKEVDVILQVCHLDHDAENPSISDSRLKAMCGKCHLAYDAKQKYEHHITNNTSVLRVGKAS